MHHTLFSLQPLHFHPVPILCFRVCPYRDCKPVLSHFHCFLLHPHMLFPCFLHMYTLQLYHLIPFLQAVSDIFMCHHSLCFLLTLHHADYDFGNSYSPLLTIFHVEIRFSYKVQNDTPFQNITLRNYTPGKQAKSNCNLLHTLHL